MASCGGISVILLVRGVIMCVEIITKTVYIMGIVRLYTVILSFLSPGVYFTLGYFQYTSENSIRGNGIGGGNSF